MKFLVNICAQDGIVSHNCGVGTMVKRYIHALCNYFKKNKIDYDINLITPEYKQDGFGFSSTTKQHNLNLKNIKIFEVSNGSFGKKFFGNIDNWKELCKNTTNLLNQLNLSDYDYVLTLANDTPFAGIFKHLNQSDNHIKVWVPHSTAKIHQIDSEQDITNDVLARIKWEKDAIKFINQSQTAYLACVGKFIKQHLIDEYKLKPEKAISFHNGEILSSSTIYEEDEQCARLFNELEKTNNILLAFGRPEKYKNLHSAMKLAKELNIDCVIVTQEYYPNMPYVQYLKQLQKETNSKLFVNVSFNFPQYIINRYKKNIILLVPSTKEIAGLVVNEIRKLNKNNLLLVVNDIDGLKEQVNDGKDGILVNLNNIKESAKKITKYFSAGEIKKINKNSLIRLKKDYDFEKICNNFIKNIIKITKKLKKRGNYENFSNN